MTTISGHKVVVAAIIEREGKILVHQRPEGSWGAGKWEFPGGKLEIGEDPRDAVVRECQEELGVDVEVGKVVEVLTHKYADLPPVILLFFTATIKSGDPKPLLGGSVEFSFRSDLSKYDWLEADLPIIEKLMS